MLNKYIILCLILFLQLANQVSICKGKKCMPGRFSFTPLDVLSQIKNNKCGTRYCRAGEACNNKICVKIRLPKPQTLPKPTEYGTVDRAVSPYSTYYCQQNIYNLCRLFDKVKKPTAEGFAVIVLGATPKGNAVIRQQKLGDPNYEYVTFWNYHVIFVERDGNKARVYDFDSRLQWGTDFQETWEKALKTPDDMNAYRVIYYKQYINIFSDDRSGYFQQTQDKKVVLKSPFPTKNTVKFNKFGRQNQFHKFNNIENRDPLYGVVMSASQFFNTFSQKKTKA